MEKYHIQSHPLQKAFFRLIDFIPISIVFILIILNAFHRKKAIYYLVTVGRTRRMVTHTHTKIFSSTHNRMYLIIYNFPLRSLNTFSLMRIDFIIEFSFTAISHSTNWVIYTKFICFKLWVYILPKINLFIDFKWI